jgi:copper homeostasis protein (lipoprotein)
MGALKIKPPATFEGVIACADCQGIRETLTLRVDGTFILRQTYLRGDPVETSKYESGPYELSGNKVVLGKGPEAQQLQLLKHGELRMLDEKGKEIKSDAKLNLKRMPVIDPIYMLEGPVWKLKQLKNRTVVSRAEITFKDQRVSGSSGCNRMTGGYTHDGIKLSFSPIAGTQMACPGPDMELESAFLKVLETIDSFRITGSTLQLLHEGTPAATFVAGE